MKNFMLLCLVTLAITFMWTEGNAQVADCQEGTIPFFDGFEIGQTDGQQLECWSQENESGSQKWLAQDHPINYGRVARTDAGYATLYQTSETWMFYPLELEAGITYELEIYAKQSYASGGNTIEAAFGTEDNVADMNNVIFSSTILTEDYKKYNGYISPTITETYYVGIKGKATDRFIMVDDILVKVANGCFNPMDPVAQNVTENSANVSWTAQGSATRWEVVYGEKGFDLEDGNEGISIILDDVEIDLADLDYNTSYDVYVRSVCADDEISDWALNIATFKTACQNGGVPFFEGFEIGQTDGQQLECWTQENDSGSQKWLAQDRPINYGRIARTDLGYATLYQTSETWMFYPLELEAGITYELEIYAKQTNATGGNTIEAAFGTEDNAAAMNNVIFSSTILTADYKDYNGYISPTITGTYYVGIKGKATDRFIMVDDISVKVADGCFNPMDPVAQNITENSANVSWTAQGSATLWEVVYGEKGFDVEDANEGISIILNEVEINLSDLDYNTTYDVYVRSVCADDEISDWALNIATFKTACQNGGVPFFEGFEIGQTDGQQLECWTQENDSGSQKWLAQDRPINYGRIARTDLGYATLYQTSETWMFYPLELEAGITYELEIYAKQTNATGGNTIEAAFGTEDNAAAMNNVIFSSTILTADYKDYNGYISPTITGTYYVGIKGKATDRFIMVDDISVKVADGCFNPMDPIAQIITENSANVSWTAQGSATRWEVVYGEKGFDVEDEDEGISIIVDDIEINLADLDYNTSYDVYVRSVCADDVLSEWALNIATFKTDCQNKGIPFFDGFEIGQTDGQQLECWTQENVSGSQKWLAQDRPINYGRVARTDRGYATLYETSEAWMFYPLELEAGLTYQLEVYAKQTNATGNNTLDAAFGTEDNAAAMNDVIFSSTILTADYKDYNGYISPTITGTYYVGIKGNATSRFIMVDDISVGVSTLSIKDHQTDYGIQLYPNPATSGAAFYVAAGQFEGHKVNLNITDILGKTIYSTTKQFDAGKIAIQPRSPIGNGVYFVHLDQDGRTVNKRLIVK